MTEALHADGLLLQSAQIVRNGPFLDDAIWTHSQHSATRLGLTKSTARTPAKANTKCDRPSVRLAHAVVTRLTSPSWLWE
eukprot:2163440-Amphidinium_carterae.3